MSSWYSRSTRLCSAALLAPAAGDREGVGAQLGPAERSRRPQPLEAVYDLELALLSREDRDGEELAHLESERWMRATALSHVSSISALS